MGKRFLPLQPTNSTPFYAFVYLTIFFTCISKSYWLYFAIPYAIINGIGYIIIRINIIKSRDGLKLKVFGQRRDYLTFMFIAALQYISIWQSMYSTSYNIIDYIIIYFFMYSHFCVFLQFFHFHTNLFAKFKLYRIFIGWIAELHYSTSLCSLYIFPVYPIMSLCISQGVMDEYKYKYSLIMVYLILYYYILYSLYLSLNHGDVNKWSYFKIDHCSIQQPSDPNHSQPFERNSKPVPLKFKEYYIGNNVKDKNDRRSLRICQISDCHLDTLWSANELRRLCKNIVLFKPDLVLLTGDFYYTKNDDIPCGLLKYALSPLTEIANKCYGVLGNHDLKTKQTKNDIERCIVLEFKKLNIKLLRNESVLHNEYTEIIGFDFIKHNTNNLRGNMMKNVLKQSKLKCISDEGFKIVLLHDPDRFEDFDGNENIVVFSGHIHGGHIGYYVFGSSLFPCFRDYSLYRMLRRLPDYGVWKKGNNYMYVHRANTLYAKGFLRFGIPAEQQSCILINKT